MRVVWHMSHRAVGTVLGLAACLLLASPVLADGGYGPPPVTPPPVVLPPPAVGGFTQVVTAAPVTPGQTNKVQVNVTPTTSVIISVPPTAFTTSTTVVVTAPSLPQITQSLPKLNFGPGTAVAGLGISFQNTFNQAAQPKTQVTVVVKNPAIQSGDAVMQFVTSNSLGPVPGATVKTGEADIPITADPDIVVVQPLSPSQYAKDAAEVFRDVPGSYWAAADIGRLYDARVMVGVGDHSFQPNAITTQAVAIATLVRTLGYGSVVPLTINPWYAGYVQEAVQLGFLTRQQAASISNKPITRLEAFLILAQVVQATPVKNYPALFQIPGLSSEDRGLLAALYEEGFLKGTASGQLDLSGTLTRAQLAAIAERVWSR